jgi:hypothetical protein
MRVALWSISIQLQGIVVLTVVVSAPGCGTGRPSQSMVLMRAVIPQMDRPTQTAASGSPLTLAVTPNPLNPATTLTFIVPPGGGSVVLTIYGVDGRRACRLVAANLAAGAHAVVWRGRDDTGRTLPSGVYFACLRTRELVQVSKLTIVQ